MNKVKIRMILRENPVPIKWGGKTIPIKWSMESPRNTSYYQFTTEGFPSKAGNGSTYTKFLNGVDVLERGFKYIFPRIVEIFVTKVFEINKKFLLVELTYVRHYNKTTKADPLKEVGNFAYITRRQRETITGFWRIYKDRLPERLDMRKSENKVWYKKTFGYTRKEQKEQFKEIFGR